MPDEQIQPINRHSAAIRLIPFIVGCALFMQTLDSMIVATVLPVMAQALHTEPVQLNIVITGYLLASAVFMPTSGWAADRFGARRLFLIAIMLFMLTSLGCALSRNLEQLVVARILQGASGALMVPVGRAILLRITPKDRLLQSIALLSIPALLGPTLGPPLGGFLATYLSWHSIFLINLPIGLLVIALILRFVEDDVPHDRPALDWKGFGLSSFALCTLLLGISAIGNLAASGLYVALLFAGSLLSGLLYVRHAKRVPLPIIDLSLLRIQTFAVSTFAGNLCRLSAGAMPFLLAIQLQQTFELDPMTAGLIIFTSAAGALVMKPLAAFTISRAGFRTVLIAASILAGAFVCVCGTFTIETPLWLVAGVLFVGGTIRSLLFTAINTIGYADLPAGSTNRASSFAAMAQHTALSVGVGCAALVLSTSMDWRGSRLLEQVDVMWAFFAIGASTILASIFFARLPRHVGANLRKQ